MHRGNGDATALKETVQPVSADTAGVRAIVPETPD